MTQLLQMLGTSALSTANIFRLETTGVALVLLSYLNMANAAHIRYAVRRIRRKFPLAVVVVGCWSHRDDADRLGVLREGAKADQICTSFREATQFCLEAAKLGNPVDVNKNRIRTG